MVAIQVYCSELSACMTMSDILQLHATEAPPKQIFTPVGRAGQHLAQKSGTPFLAPRHTMQAECEVTEGVQTFCSFKPKVPQTCEVLTPD